MEKSLKCITVFGGSREGSNQSTIDAVKALGDCLVTNEIDLVYGSGKAGLMGLVAKQVFEGGLQVLGIVPEFLWDKFMDSQDTYGDVLLVDSMHARKQAMFEKADGFIAVPGGFGTLDETIEMITWFQLELHKKPIGVLNVNHFFDPLLQWASSAIEDGFVPKHVMSVLVVSNNPEDLLKKMKEKLKILNSADN